MDNLKPEDVPEFLILDYLLKETGERYCFSGSTARTVDSKDNIEYKNDGTVFHQIMPNIGSTEFFDWYCLERKHNQFFETKEEAFLQFWKFWKIWKENN